MTLQLRVRQLLFRVAHIIWLLWEKSFLCDIFPLFQRWAIERYVFKSCVYVHLLSSVVSLWNNVKKRCRNPAGQAISDERLFTISSSLLPFHTELRGENKRTKFFIIPHELIKANINPSLTGGTNSCSGITCICSRHSWWQDWLCLPYFANISHWCLWFSVICFCAIALSLAAKQPYDMVAAFLLQNHCPLLPPQSRGLSQHEWAASRRMQAPPAQWSISAGLVLSFILDCTLEVLHK